MIFDIFHTESCYAGAYNRPIRFLFCFFFLADLSYVGFVLVSDFLDISDGKSISLFVSQNKSSPDGFIFKLKINPFPMDLFLTFFGGKPVPPQVDKFTCFFPSPFSAPLPSSSRRSRPWPVGVRPRLPPSSSRRYRPCQRPPSPAVVIVLAAATDGGGCARQTIAVPPPRELSLFCLRRHLS